MPKVGEAWYELEARDEGLVRALSKAEQTAKTSGAHIEKAVGAPVQKGLDDTAKSATRFGGAMGAASKVTGRFGGVMGSLGTGILQGVGIGAFMGVTAAAGALVSGMGHAISAASDLNETVTKSGVVFGKNAGELVAWSKTADVAMGLSQNAALGAAAQYGNLFVSLGLAQGASAGMSKKLVELAGDLASFNNVDPAEALDALRSGLVGETEPLRRFGVNMNEATLAQKALDLGLIKSTKGTLPPAIKAQAAYALILDQTKTAQGDFARTSDGLANQQRISAAKVENAFANMGQAILPIASQVVPLLADAFTGLIGGLSQVIAWIQKFVAENKILFDVLGTIAKIAIGAMITSLGVLANIVSTTFGIIGKVIGGIIGFVKPIILTFVGLIQTVIDTAAKIPGPWQEAAVGLSKSLGTMKTEIALWGADTEKKTKDVGEGIPVAVAGPVAAGAPMVADAAATGITDPVVTATQDATAAAKKEAQKTPGEIAESLIEGQFRVGDAMDSIKDAMKNSLSKTKEIAKIEGFLTGSALAKALKDKRPEVRAQATAWKTAAEERLWALKNGVPAIALKTGQGYADALAAKKKEVSAAAAKHTAAVNAKYNAFEDKAYDYGKNTGKTYANGLEDSKGWLSHQVDAYLASAKARLKALSPPKEGPMREIDEWGRKLGRTYADAFASEGRYFGFRADEFLTGGATRSLAVPRQAVQLAPGASARPQAAPRGAQPIVHVTYAPVLGTARPSEVQQAVRVLGDGIVRELAGRGVIGSPRGTF
jgi:hypothetical protein